MTKEELIELLKTARVRGSRRQFTAEMREKTLEYARGRQASLTEVAEEVGIKGWTLQRWSQKERLAREGREGGAAIQKPAMKFVRLETARQPSSSVGALEVLLAGCAIRVPVGFDEETLSNLVAILERRSA